MRRTSRQLTLDDARKASGRGGWRPGAGRPRGRTSVEHGRRARIKARHPQHVTLRLASGVASIRRRRALRAIREVIRRGQKAVLRIVHFNVLKNHVHLIVETEGARELGCAMQGFCVRLARAINRALERCGRVFAERYHVRALATPKEVRNALRYVLLNGNRHEAQRGATLWFGIDPYSSGYWFDGWADDRWRFEPPDCEQPTARATVWLLTTGWRRHGPIAFDDTPG
jgi:REP element-mobilizing transposase RayT